MAFLALQWLVELTGWCAGTCGVVAECSLLNGGILCVFSKSALNILMAEDYTCRDCRECAEDVQTIRDDLACPAPALFRAFPHRFR